MLKFGINIIKPLGSEEGVSIAKWKTKYMTKDAVYDLRTGLLKLTGIVQFSNDSTWITIIMFPDIH